MQDDVGATRLRNGDRAVPRLDNGDPFWGAKCRPRPHQALDAPAGIPKCLGGGKAQPARRTEHENLSFQCCSAWFALLASAYFKSDGRNSGLQKNVIRNQLLGTWRGK